MSIATPAPVHTATLCAVRAVRKAASATRWYVTSMMGDTAYATYAAHSRTHHPDRPVPTEREFWREKYAEEARNPGARCC